MLEKCIVLVHVDSFDLFAAVSLWTCQDASVCQRLKLDLYMPMPGASEHLGGYNDVWAPHEFALVASALYVRMIRVWTMRRQLESSLTRGGPCCTIF